MKHINATPKEVTKFGITFSVLAIGLAAFLLYKGDTLWMLFLGGSAFFLLTGLFGYPFLKPIYIGWMSFAFALGWVNTRIILGVVFYLIFTPVGIFGRLLGKDLLGLHFKRQSSTYWVKRKPQAFDQKRYEQLF
jgi:hypothetical protein